MSQVIFDSIDPSSSGTELATILNDFKNAIVSGCSGTSRPTELGIGGSWVDMTNDPNSWSFKIWTGTDDVEIFTIDLVSGVASVALAVDSFIVKKISADTAGAIIEMVKRRIATSGQVLSGDVVGEIRAVGRTDAAGNPVVAKIIWTATDDQTAAAFGGTLSFHSTPDGTATLTEHMRFINGLVETIVPHKKNSEVLASQDVATAATIAQLSAEKALVEMTGSTVTDIQGVNSAGSSQVVSIHNRSTAIVTLKHLSGSAAAADRISLPNDTDYAIGPDATATLYYCTTDTYWKLLSTSEKISGYTIDTIQSVSKAWVAPATVSKIKVFAYREQKGARKAKVGMLDVYGNAYAWGNNINGQLGVGDVAPRSSPVAVLGGLQFERVWGVTNLANLSSSYGLRTDGAAYAWGINTNGQLGVAADVVPRSSPVAVLGGLKYCELIPRESSVFGIVPNRLAYSWGLNTNGQLGIGSVLPVSTPTAVLRGIAFSKIVPISGAAGAMAVVGLDSAGTAYGWGINTNGNLGVGDVAPRSSPVAVLGGLSFACVTGGANSSRYFFVGLNNSGAAYAWGSNSVSQLGVGDQTPRSSPVAVLGGLTFKTLHVDQKAETVYGLTTAGALYAWGSNTKGQIGDGTIVDKSSPVAVLGGLTFKKIIPYKESILALTADGTAYAWGNNANGQLGVGDVTARSSPVAVLGSLKFFDLTFGDGITDQYSVFGMSPNGNMYAWGINTNGSLGIGDVTARSSPVAVLGVFAPDMSEPVTCVDLTVTPGASYTVTTGPVSNFGNLAQLGRDIYKVEIEYIA